MRMVTKRSSRPRSGSNASANISAACPPDDERIQTIIDTIPVLAWTARPDGSADFFNRQWMTFTGLSEPQALDWGWLTTVHPDDRDSLADHWRANVASGEPVAIESRLRRFDGAYYWFLIRASALLDDAGNILKWYGTKTEVEDRRRVEQPSRDSEESIRRIIDGIPGIVFTTTAAGDLEFSNQQQLDYFGRSLEELQAWHASDAVHPDDLARVVTDWARFLARGEPATTELRLRRADGVYRWFHYSSVPHRDSNGNVTRCYVLATDVDDQKRMEEDLRRTQALFSRAAHLASVSELSASIAHEVNQPLTAVVSNAHACRRWLTAEPPNIERALLSVDRIIRDGNAAADVVRRMRSLFRQAPLHQEQLDLNEVVEEVLSLMANDLRSHGVSLQTQLQFDLPRVMADRVQIQQVLVNLVRNGMEAMGSVGDRVRQLSISSLHAGREIAVDIADHGIGFDDEKLVFESFYTTKANGMGLGLAICRSIVEAHGGRIWAKRNQPHGATFGFALRAMHPSTGSDALT